MTNPVRNDGPSYPEGPLQDDSMGQTAQSTPPQIAGDIYAGASSPPVNPPLGSPVPGIFRIHAPPPRRISLDVNDCVLQELFPDRRDRERIARIINKGINSEEDVSTFFDFIEAVNNRMQEELRKGTIDHNPYNIDKLKTLSLFSAIIREFRSLGIPIHVRDDVEGSYVQRTYEEFQGRMDSPARTHGITIKKGDSIFTLFHEMAHALPLSSFFKHFGKNFGAPDIEALEWPPFPGPEDHLSEVFVKLAGAAFRDEAYAAIAEIQLETFLNITVESEAQTGSEMRAFLEQNGVGSFVRSGMYLGDNHMILYNLAAAFELAKRIAQDPSQARQEIFGSLPYSVSLAGADGDVVAWARRLEGLVSELGRFTAAIHQDNFSNHPLKPVITRLARVLQRKFKIDLSVFAPQQAPHLDVGARTVERARGSDSWITDQPDSVRDTLSILESYADISYARLLQLIVTREYDALAAVAMLIPDADLPRFWSAVIQQVKMAQAARRPFNTGGAATGGGEFHPLILPLAMQGYMDLAGELADTMQSGAIYVERWDTALFNGLQVVSRLGSKEAIDFWIPLIERRLLRFDQFEYLRQLRDAVLKLRERGFDQFAARLELVAPKVAQSVADNKVRWARSFIVGEHSVNYGHTTPASFVLRDLMIIVSLPSEYGGGWTNALGYLERIEDGFTKTAACLKLSREMNHLPVPSTEELHRLVRIWDRSLVESLKIYPARHKIQPNEEGLFSKEEWRSHLDIIPRGVRVRKMYPGQALIYREGVAAEAYKQRHRAAMYMAIPQNSSGELAQLKSTISEDMTEDEVRRVTFAPRPLNVRGARSLYHDPNLLELEVKVNWATYDVLGFLQIGSIVDRIEDVLEQMPRNMQAEYIPLLISLSARLAKTNPDRAQQLYERAHEIAADLRDLDIEEFGRRFDSSDSDLQSLYRKYQATWERAALVSLAKLVADSPPERAPFYVEEIRRIVDNESIFDVMESDDYAQVASVLDARRQFPTLVYNLYRRAIQTRVREQYEAVYDVDHELAVRIDASSLSVEEKDELLEQLVSNSFQRTASYYRLSLVNERTRDRIVLELERLIYPFNELLDITARRGYQRIQRAIWRGIRAMTEELNDSFPSPMRPFALAHPVLFTLQHHPELVHPDSREKLMSQAADKEGRERIARLYASPYVHSAQFSYPHLPTAWEIRNAFAKNNTDLIDIGKIVAEIPKDGTSVDSYVMDLLSIVFTEYPGAFYENLKTKFPGITFDIAPDWYLSKKIIRNLSQFENAFGFILRPLYDHLGVSDFYGLATRWPQVVGDVFLNRLDRSRAYFLRYFLLDLVLGEGFPVEVRAAAFSALAKTSLVSPYLARRFVEASNTTETLKEFLDKMRFVFADNSLLGGEERRKNEIVTFANSAVPRDLFALPDWFIAPLFEPLLASEKNPMEAAATAGPRMQGALGVYDVLFSAMHENGAYPLVDHPGNEQYMLNSLALLSGEILAANGADSSAADEMTAKVVETFQRNVILVRLGLAGIPGSLERINSALRFAVADYISLVHSSTRALLLKALYESEEKLGEDEVLRIFFEMTGLEKLAQFLSMQEGVVPESYRLKLKRFQEDLKPSTHREVIDTMRMSGIEVDVVMGDSENLVFEHAGTVGEMWRWELADGTKVAVKVLPWKKQRRNENSLRALEFLAGELHLFRHDFFGGLNFIDLYRRFKETLTEEMDYRTEAENLEILEPLMKGFGIAYPKVYEEFLNRDVMVMSYQNYQNIADMENAADKKRLIDVTGRWLAESIFKEGVFYEDFHPGNIKWLPKRGKKEGRPLVLDFGRIGEMNSDQRQALTQFLVSLKFEDPVSVVDGLVAMARPQSRIDRQALTTQVEAVLDEVVKSNDSTVIQRLFSIASRHGASLEPNYLQFIKAVMSWENVMRAIDPDADFSTYAAPVIVEQMAGGGGVPQSGSPAGGTPSPSSTPTGGPPVSSAPSSSGDTFSASAVTYAELIYDADEEITGIEDEGYFEDGAEIFAAGDEADQEIYSDDEIPADDMFLPSAEMLYPAEAAVPAL